MFVNFVLMRVPQNILEEGNNNQAADSKKINSKKDEFTFSMSLFERYCCLRLPEICCRLIEINCPMEMYHCLIEIHCCLMEIYCCLIEIYYWLTEI